MKNEIGAYKKHTPAIKLLSIFLSMMLLLSVTAGLDMSAYALASSGSIGNNASYTFDSATGAVVISGTGVMRDYDSWYDDASPFDSSNLVTSVVFKEGITSVSDYLFNGCKNLKTVTFANSITAIGESAFEDCESLTNFKLPNKLVYIGESAFYSCKSITKVTFPATLENIDEYAFLSCDNLKTVQFCCSEDEAPDYSFHGANVEYNHNKNKKSEAKKGSIVPASTKKDGSMYCITYCANCSELISQGTQVIPAIKTVTLNTTSYAYDGKAKKPTATVKDSKGNTIASAFYTISYKNNTKVGKATATLTFKDRYTGSVSKTFSIKPQVKSAYTIGIGDKQKISVKGASKYTFKSADKKIATVNSKGEVTGKKAGKVKITVTANGVSSTCKITVKKTGLTLSKSSATVGKGKTVKLKANAYPQKVKVTWKSSNKKVATVNSKGVVKGVAKGKATITASFKYKGKTYKKTCKVTVKSGKLNYKMYISTKWNTWNKYVKVIVANDGDYPLTIKNPYAAVSYYPGSGTAGKVSGYMTKGPGETTKFRDQNPAVDRAFGAAKLDWLDFYSTYPYEFDTLTVKPHSEGYFYVEFEFEVHIQDTCHLTSNFTYNNNEYFVVIYRNAKDTYATNVKDLQ